MAASRPFHHGNLRAVLLERAEQMLRVGGVDNLSLRELARQAGVSHGAPRSHFIDRQALLDALAVRGFDRFADQVRSALQGSGVVQERLRRVGRAYVDFAVEDAALMELMFAAKVDAPTGPVHDAAVRLFDVLDDAMPDPAQEPADVEARDRFKLLFAAAMQGTASLLAARRITSAQGQVLVGDATAALVTSELGARVLRRR